MTKIVIEVRKRGFTMYNETTKDGIDMFPKNRTGKEKLVDILDDYLEQVLEEEEDIE